MKLLYLLIVSLLVSGLAVAELVDSFDKCKEFFLTLDGETHHYPTVLRDPENNNRYRLICQTHNNKNHFATLYDTVNRIPVYSAYVLSRNNGPRPNNWRTDPDIPKAFQATNEDCAGSRGSRGSRGHGFQRGHLFPVLHAAPDSVAATMTVTNTAPQAAALNQGQWKTMEKGMSNRVNNQLCYIITGTVPGERFLSNCTIENISGGVNIPKYFWSAYCCLDNNNHPVDSGGFLAENDNKSELLRMSLSGFEEILGFLYHYPNFTVFNGECLRVSGSSVECSVKRKRKKPFKTIRKKIKKFIGLP